MKKNYLINLFAILVLFLFFSSCEKNEDIPQPNFTANQYSASNSEIVISFYDQSSNNPDSWFWAFEGGSPAISTERNPIVTYVTPGQHNVTLTVRNNDGERTIIFENYINIVSLNNTTWTPMYFEVGNEKTTVPVDGYALFSSINNSTMHYYAETSGATASGTQIGLLFYWEENLILDEINSWDFFINEYFVFINVQNEGPDDFNPFVVNYGDSEYEITDNISIENDDIWKETGYYDAWDYMKIRAYFKNDQNIWVEWNEDEHFDLLWVENQGLDLWYDGSKSTPASKFKSKELGKSNRTIKQSGIKR
jgi:PKD repeat protein